VYARDIVSILRRPVELSTQSKNRTVLLLHPVACVYVRESRAIKGACVRVHRQSKQRREGHIGPIRSRCAGMQLIAITRYSNAAISFKYPIFYMRSLRRREKKRAIFIAFASHVPESFLKLESNLGFVKLGIERILVADKRP
jgi:hypothetical protein